MNIDLNKNFISTNTPFVDCSSEPNKTNLISQVGQLQINPAKQVEEDLKWSNDKDRALIAKNLSKEAKGLVSGQDTYQTRLHLYQSLPPMGKKHFSAEERLLRLANLAQLPEKYGAVEGGVSLTLYLFQDYYHYITQNIPKELLAKRLKPRQGGPWSNNKDFKSFHMKFRGAFGSFNQLLKRGSLWKYPISVSTAQNSSIHHENSLYVVSELKKHPFLTLIRNEKLPSAKLLDELIDLLEDCTGQDISVLFNPHCPKPNHSNQFKRIQWRLEFLKEASSSFSETLKITGSKALNAADENIFAESMLSLVNFSNALSSKLSQPLTLQSQREILHLILEEKRGQYGANAASPLKKLNARVSLELNRQDKIDLHYHILFLWDLQDSIMEEGTLTCLTNLMSGLKDFKEVDATLKDALSTLEEIQNRPRDAILEMFDLLSKSDLNHDEASYFMTLKDLWTAVNFITTRMSGANIDLLRYRLQKCVEPTATAMDRAFALKDVQIQFGMIFQTNILENMDNLARIRRSDFNPSVKSIGPEISKLSDMIFELLQMNFEAIQSTKVKINYVLNEIQEQPPSQEIQIPLTAPQGKKKKNKNRKNRKSSQKAQTINTSPQTETQPRKTSAAAIRSHVHPNFLSGAPSVQNIINYNIVSNNDLPFIRKQLKLLSGIQFAEAETQHYFNANLKNIKHLIRHLEELAAKPTFGLNTIFGETDALRQLMEGVLQLAILSSKTPKEHASTLLDQIGLFGHELHRHVKIILEDKGIPKNIRRVVSQNKSIPYYFSQANACVNYLNTTRAKSYLPSHAKQLLDYLNAVNEERQSKAPNLAIRKNLLDRHQQHTAFILSFASDLFHALADPHFMPEKKESLNFASLDEEFDIFALENPRDAKAEDPAMDNAEILFVENDAICYEIHTREDALNAIESALIWLKIRSLPPAEGNFRQKLRETQRNLAFDNVRTYLMWLAEKLQSDDYGCLYDSTLEELKLMRRAHKELTIGFLYHGNYSHTGQHIIDAFHLRHKNNPCMLNQILRQNSPQASHLPNLNHEKYKWMSVAHKALSYPEPQQPTHKPTGWDKEIRKLIKNTRKYYRLKNSVQDDFILVKNKKNLSHQSIQREIQTFVHAQENEKVFTALSALLQTIIYGTTIN